MSLSTFPLELVEMVDILTTAERSKRMSLIKGRDTKPEMAVRKLVFSMGGRYRVHRPDIPGRPDMAFIAKRKVIFVHGCFWHMHRNCKKARPPKSNQEYWMPKLNRNVERDKAILEKLEREGWEYLVIWECEVPSIEALKAKLANFLSLNV
jgi:DNA mismatch endonuclease, patch repair protein